MVKLAATHELLGVVKRAFNSIHLRRLSRDALYVSRVIKFESKCAYATTFPAAEEWSDQRRTAHYCLFRAIERETVAVWWNNDKRKYSRRDCHTGSHVRWSHLMRFISFLSRANVGNACPRSLHTKGKISLHWVYCQYWHYRFWNYL